MDSADVVDAPFPEGLTLQAIDTIAMENNPAIRQAMAAVDQAMGTLTQVGLPPNPTAGYFGEEIGNGDAAGLHGAFVSQTFLCDDRLHWNRAVLSNNVEALKWQVEERRIRVHTDIRLRFYEALAAQRRLNIARDFRDTAARGVEVAQARVRALEGTRADVLQSEMQLSEVDLEIRQAEAAFEGAWKQLAAVAGVPHLPLASLVGELPDADAEYDVADLSHRFIEASPVMNAAWARVQRAHANQTRQRLQPRPPLTVQLGMGHSDGTDDAFANVQISLPLPVHNKNQGNIYAADAQVAEAIKNVERIKMRIHSATARAVNEYRQARAAVELYEESILPKAEETLDLIQQAQDIGEVDFLRVYTVRRSYFDANLRYIAALADLAQAHARIEGMLLDGGLTDLESFSGDDSLRGQALSGQ